MTPAAHTLTLERGLTEPDPGGQQAALPLHPKDTAPLACFTRRGWTDFTVCSPETGTNLSLHEGLEDTLLLS